MQAPSVDIKDILAAADTSSAALSLDLNFATDGTGNLHIGKEPAKPRNCVTIFDTSGFPPYLGLNAVGYEYPSIQIRVRNSSYVNGWNLIESIKNLLHGTSHYLCSNGTLYTVIYCSSGPALLDWDDNGNCRFVCNFNLQRRENV